MGVTTPQGPQLWYVRNSVFLHCNNVTLCPGSACMFHASAGQKSLSAGPCIDNYGEGEQAQDISLSSDGLVLLLSAGFKLSVYTSKDNL